ncbi:MAG: EF-hand domain-containing protein [Pseudomonadota bacterium]
MKILRCVLPSVFPCAGVCLLAMLNTAAAQDGRATGPAILATSPHADPYLPPAKRIPSTTPAASGPALQEQAMQKLKKQFEAADSARSGTLSAEQARAAGLGYVADHFEQIDRRKAGRVSFDDVKQFVQQRQQRRENLP